MLEPNSVDQVLRVLDLARQNRRLGFDTAAACSRAIQYVAKEANVRYQTIGDGCRRLLGLTDMSEFHRLIEDWLAGNPAKLVAVLKKSAVPAASARIGAFFATGTSSSQISDGRVPSSRIGTSGREVPSKPVNVTVDDADARMLRVLAQLEGREPAVLALDLLRVGMRDRFRATLA